MKCFQISNRLLHNLTTEQRKILDSIIRVDHAGETGANYIYDGQIAVLGNTKCGPKLKHMKEQENEHKIYFEKLMNEYRARPTVLLPIWNVAGFLLGAGTAFLGEKAAMACTVAVESVIVDHYNEQLRELMEHPNISKEILDKIKKIRDDEQEHHDVGLQYGAAEAPFYNILTEFIKFSSRSAIEISKRI